MKERVFLLAAVLLLAGQFAFSGREIAQNQLDNWTAFNAAHDDLWRITWDSLGMPAEIDGGTIWVQGANSEEKARARDARNTLLSSGLQVFRDQIGISLDNRLGNDIV